MIRQEGIRKWKTTRKEMPADSAYSDAFLPACVWAPSSPVGHKPSAMRACNRIESFYSSDKTP